MNRECSGVKEACNKRQDGGRPAAETRAGVCGAAKRVRDVFVLPDRGRPHHSVQLSPGNFHPARKLLETSG